jgi:acyl carrier protein
LTRRTRQHDEGFGRLTIKASSSEDKMRIKTMLPLLIVLGFLMQTSCRRTTSHQLSQGNPREVISTQSSSPDYQKTVERIRAIVGTQLNINAGEVDVDLPLLKQKKAADELDLVEIIMNVENTFNVEIKDDEVGESLEEIGKNLSVKKLADIVSRKKSLK